ncbi:arginine deiminase-related protein [Janthinobacterium sp. 17J80-10]|uniref:dimethylarginine dimethylaminohydrolase family protein n=1 Tax=Janthinobacterium sp. 17J80-10 TaxID=2497863 RepID=UPI0010057D84|nr:arginine deiminase-related protein [Janthinobacterium sp. 17J80-10]QAU33146.1 nitrate reductase [Janthinobacterium sp. 17J80-10]
MSDRYLMCTPEHFCVDYVINPWMQGNVAACSNDLARRQWQALADAIGAVAEVDRIAGEPGVPDMVFTANAGLVLGNTFILSRFRHIERQPEEAYFEAWFRGQGFNVQRLALPLAFEGAGDALLDRGQQLLWLGHGHRSSAECAPALSDLLDIEVEALRLVDPRFYHLDTCLCPLEGGYLMYYPGAFDADSRDRIRARVPAARRIEVDDADALAFACNAVNSGRHVFLNRASSVLAQRLASHGFVVHQTPLGEFMKAGGSAKCLTLKLNEYRKQAIFSRA